MCVRMHTHTHTHTHTHLHTHMHTHTHIRHKRIEKFILTADTGIDLREGTLFCSGNYLDKFLRIWISRSQGNKKVAEQLCIKSKMKFRGSGKWNSPVMWALHSILVGWAMHF